MPVEKPDKFLVGCGGIGMFSSSTLLVCKPELWFISLLYSALSLVLLGVGMKPTCRYQQEGERNAATNREVPPIVPSTLSTPPSMSSMR